MNDTVFVSGSMSIQTLNVGSTFDFLQYTTQYKHPIVVGDNMGTDKLVQHQLHEWGYRNVKVYHMGKFCRNNIGKWPQVSVANPKMQYGRDYYTWKDVLMSEDADTAMVYWDGKSEGSKANILRMLGMYKIVTVIYKNGYCTLQSLDDWNQFLLAAVFD